MAELLPRLALIVPLLLAIILLPASLVALVQPVALPVPLMIIGGGLFVALHVLAFVASRKPLLVFALASAIMLVLTLLPVMTGIGAVLYPSGLVYLLCLHQVAVRCDRRWAFSALAVAVAGSAIVAVTTLDIADPLLRLGVFLSLVAANAAAWAFGLLQRVRRAQAIEHERMRMREAASDERARISAELHDVVAHALTVMVAQTEVARGFLREQPEVSERALGVVLDSGRDALRGMRGIVREEVAGAVPQAPTPDLTALPGIFDAARSPETSIRFHDEGECGVLPAPTALAVLSVVREGLTNAIRHTAPPRDVHVRLDRARTSLAVSVEDDGGSGLTGSGAGTGTGLAGLAERVRLAGGALDAGPAAEGGWRLRAVLTLEDPDAEEEGP